MSPLPLPVFMCRIDWNVTPLVVPVVPLIQCGTSLHSMIRSLPLIFQSTALSVPPEPLALVIQSSIAGAIAAVVGVEVRSDVSSVVDAVPPSAIQPLASTLKLV